MNNFGTGAEKDYRFVSTRLPRRTSRLAMTKFWDCARNENLFGAFSYTICAYLKTRQNHRPRVYRTVVSYSLFRCPLSRATCISKTEHEPQGGEQISAELTSQSPFCNDYNPLQSFAFRSLCSFFPRAKNCAFIFLTHAQVRLFLTCGSPCVWSTSEQVRVVLCTCERVT